MVGEDGFWEAVAAEFVAKSHSEDDIWKGNDTITEENSENEWELDDMSSSPSPPQFAPCTFTSDFVFALRTFTCGAEGEENESELDYMSDTSF